MAIEESLDKLKSQERPTDKEEDRKRQKNNMIFSKILSTSHNMMEFAIPKEKIMDCVNEIKRLEVDTPVKIGQIILDNVAGTGVPVVATSFSRLK